MIALKMTDVKKCMSSLLLKDVFDPFSLIEAEIVTYNTFRIDGYIKKEFYKNDTEPSAEYSDWRDVREFCFSIIKGKRTPLSFKFIFSLSSSETVALLQSPDTTIQAADVQGLYLNFRFENDTLHCITGTSLKVFSMDKSLDKIWDNHVRRFFTQHELAFEDGAE